MHCSHCNNNYKLRGTDETPPTLFLECPNTNCSHTEELSEHPGLEEAIHTLINGWDDMPKTEIIILMNYEFGSGFLRTMRGLKKGVGRSDVKKADAV